MKKSKLEEVVYQSLDETNRFRRYVYIETKYLTISIYLVLIGILFALTGIPIQAKEPMYIGGVIVLIAVIFLVLHKENSKKIQDELRYNIKIRKGLRLAKVFKINDTYCMEVYNDEMIEKLEIFLSNVDDPNVKKLRKYLNAVNPMTRTNGLPALAKTIKGAIDKKTYSQQVATMITTYSGICIHPGKVVSKASGGMIDLDEGKYFCTLKYDNDISYEVFVKRMKKDNMI